MMCCCNREIHILSSIFYYGILEEKSEVKIGKSVIDSVVRSDDLD